VIEELATAFGIGVLATASPCALPLYPGFLAYLASGSPRGGSVRWLGLAVLAGVLTMMIAIGALIASLQVAVGQVLVVVTPLADLVVIALGVALLLGRDPFARLPAIASTAAPGGEFRGAFVYGLMYGPIALPCSGALLVSIFSLSVSLASFLEKMLFFVVFGLGFGVPLLPLLLISLLAAARQRALVHTFTAHHAVVTRAAGVILVAVGAIDLAMNLPLALLDLGYVGA
jgi:cytochrome c-type biogenesis protein